VWITAGLGTDRTVSAEVATRFGRGARFTAERRAASEKPTYEKPTSDNPWDEKPALEMARADGGHQRT